jgi:hypothetical protein
MKGLKSGVGARALTAERVRELLDYNPETGVFTWRVSPSWNARAGDVTGCPEVGGYLRIVVDRYLYKAHRLAWLYMAGEWPKAGIDHVDGNPANNRWHNLRQANQSQNMANSRRLGPSGFKGITWNGQKRKWVAQIKVNGKQKHLGYFDSAEGAFIQYIFAAWRDFGDYAYIDAGYIRAVNKRRALEKKRRMIETVVLYNLANPDYIKLAA